MKIQKMLTLAIIANILFIGRSVCVGVAQAETGSLQTVVVEVSLGPQENALMLEIKGDTLPAFEVSCRDDGEEHDSVRNDSIQTCHGEVPVGIDLSFSLRVGGGEMVASVPAAGSESEGRTRYFEWIESGLHQVEEPVNIGQATEPSDPEQPHGEPVGQPKSSPALPFILGIVAGLGFATALIRSATKGGLTPAANLIGFPPDIEFCRDGADLDTTINELLEIGPLVVAHPESLEIAARDSVNIISVTERDVVDVIDALKRLATVYPTQRIAVVVVGDLDCVGDPGVTFIERLTESAPLGSVVRVLK